MMRGNLHTLWILWFSKRNLKDLVFFINIKISLIHWSFTVNAGLRSVEPHYIIVYVFLLIFILIKHTNSLHILNLESSLPRVKTVDWFFNWSNLVDNLIVVVVVGEISLQDVVENDSGYIQGVIFTNLGVIQTRNFIALWRTPFAFYRLLGGWLLHLRESQFLTAKSYSYSPYVFIELFKQFE